MKILGLLFVVMFVSGCNNFNTKMELDTNNNIMHIGNFKIKNTQIKSTKIVLPLRDIEYITFNLESNKSKCSKITEYLQYRSHNFYNNKSLTDILTSNYNSCKISKIKDLDFINCNNNYAVVKNSTTRRDIGLIINDYKCFSDIKNTFKQNNEVKVSYTNNEIKLKESNKKDIEQHNVVNINQYYRYVHSFLKQRIF